MSKQPFESLKAIEKFDHYPTRAAYHEATGNAPPPFDPARLVKRWEDPDAVDYPFGSVYQSVLAQAGPNGNPRIIHLAVPFTDRGVNLPDDVPGGSSGATGEYPAPIDLGMLGPYQEIVFHPSPAGGVVIRNKDVPTPGEVGAGFTPQDRELLQRIATKLGA